MGSNLIAQALLLFWAFSNWSSPPTQRVGDFLQKQFGFKTIMYYWTKKNIMYFGP